jgi:hypothetical protein
MQRQPWMRRCRSVTWKTWLGAALAVWLLTAEAFAVAHQYDSAAHGNGQACAVCVSVASFGAANVAAPVHFELARPKSFVVVAAGIVFFSVVPAHRYARGPPSVSFAS